jgi:hypothetical protein
MQWYYEIIPLLIGIFYRSIFYGLKSVLGVELGLRLLSSALQIAAFHYGGLPADILLLLIGFTVRVLVYGPNFYAVEVIALLASIIFRLGIYFSEFIYDLLYPTEEDKSKALVPVPPTEEARRLNEYLKFLYPDVGDVLPVALTSF